MSFVNVDVWLKRVLFLSDFVAQQEWRAKLRNSHPILVCAAGRRLNLLPKRHFLALLSSSPVTSQSFSSSLSAVCMRHRCVKQLSEERLNKQAGPGTKNPPLRDMWQQNPLNPHPQTPPTNPPYPSATTLKPSHSYWSHTNRSIPWAWSQEKERWRRRGEQILIPIHRMSPPHKGDRMTLPLNQS